MALLAVMIAWVFFAAPDFEVALGVLQGMAGLNGIGPRPPVVGTLTDVALRRVPFGLEGEASIPGLVAAVGALAALALGWLLVLLAPNSQSSPPRASRWRPRWACSSPCRSWLRQGSSSTSSSGPG